MHGSELSKVKSPRRPPRKTRVISCNLKSVTNVLLELFYACVLEKNRAASGVAHNDAPELGPDFNNKFVLEECFLFVAKTYVFVGLSEGA